MFSSGVVAIDKLLNKFPAGRNIQLAGVPDGKMTEIGLNMLKDAKKPAYFNLNGLLDLTMAEEMFGKDLMVYGKGGDSSENAMKIIEYMVENDLTDRIVIDDLPSIVSQEERDETGTELESLQLIVKTLIKIKLGCIKKGITIIWINQARSDERNGLRIWGGDFITRRMQATVLCETAGPINHSRMLAGFEISLKVVYTKAEFARRRTIIGVFNDGSISYAYWLFKEAKRYRLISYEVISKDSGRYGFVYNGVSYQNKWKIIELIEGDKKFRENILGQIDAEEEKRSFYK